MKTIPLLCFTALTIIATITVVDGVVKQSVASLMTRYQATMVEICREQVQASQADVVEALFEIDPTLNGRQRCLMVCFYHLLRNHLTEKPNAAAVSRYPEELQKYGCHAL